nr:cellulase/esterase cele [Quercus suber]
MRFDLALAYLLSTPICVLTQQIAAAEPRTLGRVNPLTGESTWPSTGLAFTFTGTSASIDITASSGAISADLFIDNLAPIVIQVASDKICTPELPDGKHTISLRKRSEAALGTVTFGDIAVNGSFEAAAMPTRRIEIIGDSISVGYGLDGTAPCTNTAAVEDNPQTYAALAAEMLAADYSVVAWSGKGLIRNVVTGTSDTSPLMPELYTRYGANDPDYSYTYSLSSLPDAIVIALGTNDFSYVSYETDGTPYSARPPINATAFTAGMVDFVQQIEQHYPSAQFFLLSSPMLSDLFPTTADAQHTTQVNALKAAVAQIGMKAHFVDWPTQGSATGCDYHPNAQTHAEESVILADAIKSALKW